MTTGAPITSWREQAEERECCSFSHSDVVECPPGVIETLMDNNVSRSAPGNGVMNMAGSMGASVGVCYGLWGKKGENEDLERE